MQTVFLHLVLSQDLTSLMRKLQKSHLQAMLFWVKIKRRPDNFNSISQNNCLLHHFSVYFLESCNSVCQLHGQHLIYHEKTVDFWAVNFNFRSRKIWLLSQLLFSWWCCILTFCCFKLYFQILFSIHLSF